MQKHAFSRKSLLLQTIEHSSVYDQLSVNRHIKICQFWDCKVDFVVFDWMSFAGKPLDKGIDSFLPGAEKGFQSGLIQSLYHPLSPDPPGSKPDASGLPAGYIMKMLFSVKRKRWHLSSTIETASTHRFCKLIFLWIVRRHRPSSPHQRKPWAE